METVTHEPRSATTMTFGAIEHRPMTVYRGRIDENLQTVVEVLVGEQDPVPLDPRIDLVAYSDGGLAWGYEGAESRQLALALTAHALGDDDRAVMAHHHVVTALTELVESDWSMTREEILDLVR